MRTLLSLLLSAALCIGQCLTPVAAVPTVTVDGAFAGLFTGPYLSGSTLYFLLQQQANDLSSNPLQVYASTNSGTTWTLQDNAHSPILGLNDETFSSHIAGTKLYSAYPNINPDGSGDKKLRVSTFDLPTNLWDGALFASGGPTITTFFPGTNNVGTSFSTILSTSRSNGDFLVAYDTVRGAGNHFWPAFATFIGGVWSGATFLGHSFGSTLYTYLNSLVIDGSDLITAFFTEATAGSPDTHWTLYSQTIRTNGTVGTVTNISDMWIRTWAGPPNPFRYNGLEVAGQAVYNSSLNQIAIPFADTSGHITIAFATSADPAVWTVETVDTTQPEWADDPNTTAAIIMATATWIGGNLAVEWRASNGNIYRSQRTAPATWTAPTQINHTGFAITFQTPTNASVAALRYGVIRNDVMNQWQYYAGPCGKVRHWVINK